jgi:hypothetical protein
MNFCFLSFSSNLSNTMSEIKSYAVTKMETIRCNKRGEKCPLPKKKQEQFPGNSTWRFARMTVPKWRHAHEVTLCTGKQQPATVQIYIRISFHFPKGLPLRAKQVSFRLFNLNFTDKCRESEEVDCNFSYAFFDTLHTPFVTLLCCKHTQYIDCKLITRDKIYRPTSLNIWHYKICQKNCRP